MKLIFGNFEMFILAIFIISINTLDSLISLNFVNLQPIIKYYQNWYWFIEIIHNYTILNKLGGNIGWCLTFVVVNILLSHILLK